MSPFDVAIGLALLVAGFVVPVVVIAVAVRRHPLDPPVVVQPDLAGPRCSVALCSERAPWVIKGWPLCTDHAAPILERRTAS